MINNYEWDQQIINKRRKNKIGIKKKLTKAFEETRDLNVRGDTIELILHFLKVSDIEKSSHSIHYSLDHLLLKYH